MKRLFLSLFVIASLTACTKLNGSNAHVCKWDECPYKGITLMQYPQFAEGDEGTDLYCIDLLHIIHPTLEYDELEELLFSPMKPIK